MLTKKPIHPTQLTPPEVVEKMYMQINNISQAFAVAILIDTLAERLMNSLHALNSGDITALFLAFTSLCISIIFWTRYYFDTFIIKRSFSVKATVWFFAYIVAEGFSFKQIYEPVNWLFSTGIFLVFGFGFYILNLAEIRIKQKTKVKINLPENYAETLSKFIRWQQFRLAEVLMLAVLAFISGVLALAFPSIQYFASAITLAIALWQLAKSRDYKKFGFSDSHV